MKLKVVKTWTGKDLNKVVDLVRKRAIKIEDAAQEFGMSRATIYRALGKKGIVLPKLKGQCGRKLIQEAGSIATCIRKRNRKRRGGRKWLTELYNEQKRFGFGNTLNDHNGESAMSELNELELDDFLQSESKIGLLSEIEESVLEEKIIDLIKTGHVMTVTRVRRICFEYYFLDDENRDPENQWCFDKKKRLAPASWFAGFIKHHPVLRISRRGKITINRHIDPTFTGNTFEGKPSTMEIEMKEEIAGEYIKQEI